ncbi:hypothetical protein CK203_017415 [Vitis vinifera]|uniref:Retrotransposon gag domain-containing protein n=1 Tax=Vitis vinifera TaxID=29760 RepID=A0A438IXN8_VITVI|nr:hypothetical protein CK203_017415 [Vitis vinifera]
MTLDIGNDALLCKVFPASLQGQTLSWFHRLPPNSVDNFRDLSEAFVGQYLCSARHKQNISTLQNIKMRDNESLREFVKQFGQAVLQIEACSMDAVLQIFKRSICPGTPFFESLAKKPPTTMDDLFRRANKYSMLEDDVRAATQQVLVAGRPARIVWREAINLRIGQSRLTESRKGQGLSDFRWPRPIGTDPSTRIVVGDVSSIRIMAIQRKHAELFSFWDVSQHNNLGALGSQLPPRPSSTILTEDHLTRSMTPGGKRQKLLRAASIRERINSIRPGLTGEGPRPIDGTIIFPPVDPARTLQPHRDALILSLEIGDFDVRRILVDPAVRPTWCKHQSLTAWDIVLRALKTPDESYPDLTDHQPHPWEISYCRAYMAPLHESYPLYISSNGEFSHQRWPNRPIWQPISPLGQCYQIAREAGANQEDASPPEPSIAHDQ